MGEQSADYKAKRSTRWIYSTLPANIAFGPLSGVITLYILQLGGTVIAVSYAIAFASALAIPAAFFWGYVSDLFQRRRAQILVSYIGLAVALLAFVLMKSVIGVVIVYGAYAFVTASSAPPLNLLVMETSPRQRWPKSFSRLQYMASLGSTIGLAVAVIVTGLLSLKELMLVFLAMAAVSSVLTMLLVYQPKERMHRINFTRSIFAFTSRVFMSPVMILKVPSFQSAARLWRKMSSPYGGYRKLTIIYYAIFVFSLGSGLFNTAYPAGLKQVGISQPDVFVVLLAGAAAQVSAFFVLGTSFAKGAKISTIKSSLVLRAASYIAIGIAFVLYTRSGAFISGLIFYPIASGIAYAFYYTSSNALVFNSLSGPDKGSALGAYTAIMGIGTFIGSLLSGYTSFYIGYWFTFIAGGALILLSGHIFAGLRHMHDAQNARTGSMPS